MKTNWDSIRVCNNCTSLKIRFIGDEAFCKKCGHRGANIVLRRYIISFFKIEKEYTQYGNMVNPFDKQR